MNIINVQWRLNMVNMVLQSVKTFDIMAFLEM